MTFITGSQNAVKQPECLTGFPNRKHTVDSAATIIRMDQIVITVSGMDNCSQEGLVKTCEKGKKNLVNHDYIQIQTPAFFKPLHFLGSTRVLNESLNFLHVLGILKYRISTPMQTPVCIVLK